MLTDHVLDLAEAQLGAHDRSQRAAFEGFLSKPFDLEVPLNTVAGDVQNLSARPCPFQCSAPRSSTANTCRSGTVRHARERMGARRWLYFTEADSSSRQSRG